MRSLYILLVGIVLSAVPTPVAANDADELFEAIATSEYAGSTGRDGSILRLYTSVFRRLPDAGGFNFWVNTNQWDLRQVAAFFASSPEFIDTYGDLDDEAFVRQMYLNVLGRDGEDGGVAFWIGIAGTVGRAEVVVGFSESAEYIENTTFDAITPDGSTLAGVTAAQWSDSIEITIDTDTFRFVSDGLPNHELPDQFLIPNDGNMPPFDGDDIEAEFTIADTDSLIVASPIDVDLPLVPVYSDTVTLTSLGTIGVTISGAPLFNDYEDQNREFVALDDNLSLDGVYFIDACSGHPLQSGESYHYHGVPYCVTDTVDVAGQHSTIIGFLLDGFPLYGSKDANGETLTNADLDECSGHFGATPEFPEGIYHYHLTEDANPYSIDCYHGEIDDAGLTTGGPPVGGPPGGGPPN